MGGIRGPSRTGLERKQWADGDVCYCVCIDELTDVCLYIHVCMPIYEKLYRCKSLKPVKLGGILQSSQQGQDFPHLGNTQDCFLLQDTSKRELNYLKVTCGTTFFEDQHQVRSSSPVFPRTALHLAHIYPVQCAVLPEALAPRALPAHTSRPAGSQLATVTSSVPLSALLPPPLIHLLSYSLTDLLLLHPNSPV